MHKWATLKTALKDLDNWKEYTEELSTECTTRDEFEKKANRGLERIEGKRGYEVAIEEFDTYWTYEALIDRKTNLLEGVIDLLPFDHRKKNVEWYSELSAEFAGRSLKQKVSEEMKSREGVIVAENSNYLPNQ